MVRSVLIRFLFEKISSGFLYLFMIGSPIASQAFSDTDSLRFEALQKESSEFIAINYHTALAKANEAMTIANRSGYTILIARAYNQLGILYWIDGFYARSIYNLDKAYDYFMEIGDIKSAASTSHTKALDYYYQAMNDSALFYHQEALDLYRGIGDEKSAGKVIEHMGLVYHKSGNYKKAVDCMLEASAIRHQLPPEQALTYDLHSSNPAFRDSSYYQQELLYHSEFLQKAINMNDSLKIANAKHSLGLTYYQLNEYEESLQYFNESNTLYNQQGHLAFWNESAKALHKLGRDNEALNTLESHEKVIRERGTRISLSVVYMLKGDIYYDQGNFNEAINQYKSYIDLCEQMNNRLTWASYLNKLSKCYLQLGDYRQAKIYSNKSLTLALAIEAIEIQKSAFDLLSRIESETGHYQEAYNYHISYSNLLDRINEGEASLNMINAQIKFETFQKGEEIQDLKLEGDLQKAELANQRLIIMSIIGFTITIMLVSVLLYRKSRSNARMAKVLGKKNHEIEVLLGEVHHRVKNNLQVISSLLSIQSSRLKDKKARLAVIEGQNRVHAMGLIHENLYQHDNFSGINMKDYLHHLSSNLVASFGLSETVRVDIETHNLKLDVDTAIPIGLITNELVTNSLKYAFENVDLPVIKIQMELQADILSLEITDNGQGFEKIETKNTFGLSLVKELTKRLEGKIDFVNNNGTKVCISFKKYKVAA